MHSLIKMGLSGGGLNHLDKEDSQWEDCQGTWFLSTTCEVELSDRDKGGSCQESSMAVGGCQRCDIQ